MSNILVTDVVGTGIYAIPAGNAELDAASAGFAALLSGLSGLVFADALAWVWDTAPAAGGEGTRALCCYIRTYQFGGSECPSAIASHVLLSGIKFFLEQSVDITSVGEIKLENMRLGEHVG
jgi:hypothetical protein